jgi:soluble lytic murein transglycosylase
MLGKIQPRYLYALGALVLTLGVALGATLRKPAAPEPDAKRDSDPAMPKLASLLARTEGRPAPADLMAFEGANGGTRAAALARFLRGYLAADAQDWSGALAAFDSGDIERSTSLGDYAALYKGRALVQLGRQKDAERFLKRVRSDYPDSIVARDATVEAGRAAVAAADPASAVDDLKPLVEAGDGEAAVITGDARAAQGDTSGAIALYRRAYFYDPASPSGAVAANQLRALGADPATLAGTEQEMLSRANRLFAAQQWRDASDAYGRLLGAFPNVKDREKLLVRRTAAAAGARDADTAAASAAAVSNRDPDLQAEALYQLAMAYRRAARADMYEQTGARLRSGYPKSEWTGRFLADYADYLESKNRGADQFQVERALVQGFPLNDKAASASYERAWLAYKTGDYRQAADLFAEHLATFRTPTTKWIGEAAFWGGKANERLGNIPRALFFYNLAATRYPYGYHGHVAKNRIADLAKRQPNAKPEEPSAGSALEAARSNALAVQPIVETADESVAPRFAHADDLEAIRLWDLASGEIAAAQGAFPTSPRVALRYAQLFAAKGDNYQATLALRKGYPDVYSYSEEQMPRAAWQIMFPLTNWETIQRYAKANNLDPFIVAGLIRQESVFNPKALSRANARGLMQLLPSTGRLVAKTQGLGAVGPADLYNPTVNITLGTAYLAQQLGKFGRVELAAAAYNAGPGRVVQWQAARPVEPIEEWVENIPISETRGYVQGVLRYAANYRRFYGKGNDRESTGW